MKTLFYTKTIIAMAVAIAAAACAVSQAQEQPIPPPAAESALPADIVPGSALAEVLKMVQAGVDVGTINSYIVNSPSAFNLDADKIIFLKDAGIPSDLINAMMERDKTLYANTVTPAPVSIATSSPDTAPPPTEVTVNYFTDSLTPYGSWVDVEGYGQCWRPTVVIYDPVWQPYCDRGHWVYTDYGWYWDSDYAWGVTFHYGRWFRNPRFGWCWYPDTVWAPSWVTWRSNNDYCGWAPLPPLAVYRPGLGFFYGGLSVAVDFDFGLDAGCFTFISPDHFCDRRPRYYCLEPQRAAQIFHQTRVINDFNVNSKAFVNRGISVQQISSVTHHPIEPVHVGSLPNAGRQGWRGEGFSRPVQHSGIDNNAGRNFPDGNGQLRPAMHSNNGANANSQPNFGHPAPVPHQSGNQAAPSHLQPSAQMDSQVGQHDRPVAAHYSNPQSQPSASSPADVGDRTVYQGQRHVDPQLAGNNRIIQQPQQFQQTQPRQFIAPVAPAQPVSQNVQQQNRSLQIPVASLPQRNSSLPVEQRQFVVPSQPRVEPPQSIAETPPRNASPPPPPAPAPVQNPAHNVSAGPAHAPDKDKQNH